MAEGGSMALLVAGPLALDDIGEDKDLIGGAGGYAALAAAPLAPTQLWSRGGAVPPAIRPIFERRRVDCSGVDWTGRIGGDPALPAIEPVTAERLGGVLLIDLAVAELERALAVVRALPNADTRPLIIAPRDRGDAALGIAAAAADVLIVRSIDGDPLAQGLALQARGAKCVAVTGGMTGGIVLYGQKVTTWPTMPTAVVEPTGAGASFAGAMAAWCAAVRKTDFVTIKRALAMASAVASVVVQGVGPKKMLGMSPKEYYERFNKLRRVGKY